MNSLTLTLAQDAGPLEKMIFRNSGSSGLAHYSDKVFMGILYFDIFWFVLLMGLMFYWVVKYRRRPGVPPQRSAHHNTKLELVWTIVPSVFLGAMFYFGFQGYITKLVAPTDAETIDVVGQKWDWGVTYRNGANSQKREPMGGNNTAPVILVPVGRPVQFRMTSTDVLHSFWIPDFRFKFDVMPNRYTSFWIEAEEPGDHWIFCAEYCGEKHSEMSAILRAVSVEEYEATIAEWAPKGGTPAERGMFLARGKGGCVACHSVDGTALVGPTWRNAWGNPVKLADGTTIPGDDDTAWLNYAIESIRKPSAKIHETFSSPSVMPVNNLTDDEVNNLAAYIRSLSDKYATPEETPAEQN